MQCANFCKNPPRGFIQFAHWFFDSYLNEPKKIHSQSLSILTALGFIISTLTLSLTGGTGGTGGSTPPSDGIKEWIKKHLKALGSALGKLAEKAEAALPGIIGSIVSWLLNLLAKTTTWLSQNLWGLIVAIAGLLYIFAKNYLTKS